MLFNIHNILLENAILSNSHTAAGVSNKVFTCHTDTIEKI